MAIDSDGGAGPAADRGVYPISVAAELSGISIQTLRLYERRGLLEPARTGGGSRRYSGEDLARLRRISMLLADGVNLTGIAAILDLQDHNDRLQDRNDQLQTDNTTLRDRNTTLRADNDRLRTAATPPEPRHHPGTTDIRHGGDTR